MGSARKRAREVSKSKIVMEVVDEEDVEDTEDDEDVAAIEAIKEVESVDDVDIVVDENDMNLIDVTETSYKEQKLNCPATNVAALNVETKTKPCVGFVSEVTVLLDDDD